MSGVCKALIRQPAPLFLAFPAAVSPVMILSRLFAKTTLAFNITFFYLPVMYLFLESATFHSGPVQPLKIRTIKP